MADIEFSLASGGPFHALLRKLGLDRDDEHDGRRQSVAVVAVSGIPLLVFALMDELLGTVWLPLVRDPSVYLRIVALPLFIAAEGSLDRRCRIALERLVSGQIVTDTSAVNRITASATRLR